MDKRKENKAELSVIMEVVNLKTDEQKLIEKAFL